MKYALIFDSFWSNNSIAYLCTMNGITPIHIFSSRNAVDNALGRQSVAYNYFLKSLVFESIDQLMHDLQEYDIEFVFGCSDVSQPIVHDINLLLKKHVNPDFLDERDNKFNLYKMLGQPASQNNFLEFIKTHGKSIIKPSPMGQSGGLNGVTVVDGNTVISDLPNAYISKFFEGEEYAIDIVSCEGEHKLVAVWKYVKRHHSDCFRSKMELIKFEDHDELISGMYQAVNNWLDLLNYQFGPTSTEVKFDGNSFFCIEINFRLHGHMTYNAWGLALYHTQPDLTFACYANSKLFNELTMNQYQSKGYISKLYCVNHKTRLDSEIPWSTILSSQSVVKVWKHSRNDELLQPKIANSLTDCLAIMILFNESKEQLCIDETNVLKLFD